jgi:hypothetical protein
VTVGAWHELFVEDREDAPYVVYRPNPFKSVSGDYIQEPYISDPSKAPQVVAIDDADLVSLQASRSDDGVANFIGSTLMGASLRANRGPSAGSPSNCGPCCMETSIRRKP